MSKELDTKNPGSQPNISRRQLSIGLLAVLAGGLGGAKTVEAFPRGSKGAFIAASRILAPYGVRVTGDDSGAHDVLSFETVPLAATEYTQVVGPRNALGEIQPCIKTSVFEDDASFTHFHPGEVIPCVKTTIEGHTLATHELFDADGGGIIPCLKIASEMLEGGVIGAVEVTIDDPDLRLSVHVGDKTYNLVAGELVLEQTPR